MSTVTFSVDDNCFLSGTVDGFIYNWEGVNCTKTRKMHEGGIMAMAWVDGVIYSSGSKDNLLKLSTYDGQVTKTYQLPSYAKSIDAINNKIVVGTKCGRIITIDGENTKEIMHGHWTGETWGLAVAPNGIVYTAADDNFLFAFNPKTSKVEK
jgi:outer membrane protein assembly factor BamB